MEQDPRGWSSHFHTVSMDSLVFLSVLLCKALPVPRLPFTPAPSPRILLHLPPWPPNPPRNLPLLRQELRRLRRPVERSLEPVERLLVRTASTPLIYRLLHLGSKRRYL